MMSEIRKSIDEGRFSRYKENFLAEYGSGDKN
jgi:queuine/archaeosine tRNA-ribosyltransferase